MKKILRSPDYISETHQIPKHFFAPSRRQPTRRCLQIGFFQTGIIPCLWLFFLTFLPAGRLLSADSTLVRKTGIQADICQIAVGGLETWLESTLLAGDALLVYFNITQPEFEEFIDQNGIEDLKLDFFWQSREGDLIKHIQTETLSDLDAAFKIENWAATIQPADTLNGYYLVQATVNSLECGEKVYIPIVTEQIEDEEEILPIELPEFECGASFQYDSLTNENPLLAALPGDVFIVGGFPILLETVSGSDGYYSGEGIVPLPFSKKCLRVEFSGVFVNTDKKVISGQVFGVSDSPANYPNFNPDTSHLSIGGDICLPPPPPPGYDSNGANSVTGLDDFGFDPATGLHNTTGTEYDPNGFDINGVHQNGTLYNDCGCSREGVTENNEPCKPDCGPNPESENYAAEIADTLASLVDTLVAQLQAELQAELAALDCDAIRDDLDDLVETLGYDTLFIFGENHKYYNLGMHLEFQDEPKPLAIHIDRNPDAVLLENRHIDLYHCDKKEVKFTALLNALNAMASGANLEDLVETILDRIKVWTEYQLNLYSNDPDLFEEWVLKQIGDIMRTNSGLSDAYFSLKETMPYAPEYDPASVRPPLRLESQPGLFDSPGLNKFKRLDFINATAALPGQSFAVPADKTSALQEAAFYFLQGQEWINGVNRAFYLEELANQQALNLNGEGDNILPIEITKTIDNKTYTIYLDQVVFTPSGAILDAYLLIEDPESGKKIAFRALDVPFGPTGLQVESRMSLATDVEIRLNNAAMLVLKGTPETYVAWDCEGFSSMGIDAEIEFCRNFIVPLDTVTLEPLPDPERYRLQIQVQDVHGWLEFYAVVNAKPFAVANYENVKWSLTNMVIDFSSTATPEFTPMDGYDSPYWDGYVMAPQWKGFYVENLSATLPNEFSNSSEPIVASAFDILIDDCGFTGGVSVENLISINDGNLDGWPFSIDEFQIRILKNQFAGAGLAGEVNVPIFEENFEYEAIMYPGNKYSFSVSPDTTVTVNFALATGQIYESSQIYVEYDDGQFLAVATLNGKLIPNGSAQDTSSFKFSFPSLNFEGFQVSNQSPYFSPGHWGECPTTGQQSQGQNLNGFGLRIDNLVPYSPGEGEIGLGFDIDVVLEDALGVSAGGTLGIEGMLTQVNGRQKWVYKGIHIGELHIDATISKVHVQGSLAFFGSENDPDPDFGQGFHGVLSAEFDLFSSNAALKAAAQFGKKDGYKYFFVDMLADLGSTGVNVGFLSLNGFGGGVSYHMDISQNQVLLVNTSGQFALPPIGGSFSGTVYSPDSTKGLGLKASAVIATTSKTIMNGVVSLQFLFNSNNGLDKIKIQGSGQFLRDIDLGIQPDFPFSNDTISLSSDTLPPPSVASKLSAYIDLSFNFSEPSFHGSLITFFNAGTNLRGSGPGGKLVDAELHFDRHQWYIYIGRPEEGRRCGIIFDVPGLGGVHADAYLDIGNNVPPMAQLPEKVREIAYKVNNNQTLRQSGSGFVLGASIGFDLSAKIAGIISANLAAEAGFDLMLRKYDGLSCQGSSEPVGIDGWYASGQMWAYVSGNLKVFGVNVIDAGLAAVLQARLPNPFWAQATVGVKFKLLFVTVRKSLKLELGNDCILTTDDPNTALGMEVITALEPFDGANAIETNAQPEAYFGLALDQNVSIQDLNGYNQTYQANLYETRLINQGVEVPHSVVYAEDKTSIRVIPAYTFASEDSVTFEVTVRVMQNGSFLADETKSITFVTGPTLRYIPETNVAASYPVNGMSNFYKEEYTEHEGYILLETGQPDLLYNIPPRYAQKMRLTSSAGDVSYFNYTYDGLSRSITFPLDPAQLESGELYKLELVRISNNDIPASAPAASGSLLDDALAETSVDSYGPSAGEEAVANPEADISSVLYTIYFRVSQYNTFEAKVNAVMATSGGLSKTIGSPIEKFDGIEVKGHIEKYEPLVGFQVNLNNTWINSDINPFIAQLQNYISCTDAPELIQYDLGETGCAITGGYNRLVKEEDFLAGNYSGAPFSQFLQLTLEDKAGDNIGQLKSVMMTCNQVASTMNQCQTSGQSSPLCQEMQDIVDLFNQQVPALRNGNYTADIRYHLPGKQISTYKTLTFTKN